MRKTIFVWTTIISIGLLYSCNNSSEKKESRSHSSNEIVQREDGTISLNLEKADCYSDMVNPSGNTAEWSVVVSKAGRYNVWLSSATKDTTDLRYKNNVLVSVQDIRIEGHPNCDKIVLDSKDVAYPYFRCDSFIGSMYIQDTGVFNVQVISEKILPKDYEESDMSGAAISRLLSVSFTPEKRN
jgi:hypothetical protein